MNDTHMKRADFLERWGVSALKLNIGIPDAEFKPTDPDRQAAWELYVALLTRITTQHLPPEDGDEKTALDSVHALFHLTREILRKHGPGSNEFAKLALPVLNQIIRPCTAKRPDGLSELGFLTHRRGRVHVMVGACYLRASRHIRMTRASVLMPSSSARY
jgi:hypothetical protein